MNVNIFNEYKIKNKMTCTQTEFETFMRSVKPAPINVSYKFYKFSDKYKGVIIENPTGDKNAIYYTITIGGQTYLQNHNPFKEGLIPITNKDKLSVVKKHIDDLKVNIIVSDRFNKALIKFKK